MKIDCHLPFAVEHFCSSTAARAGRLTTLHNEVETPVFMPVATNAAMRGMPIERADELGASIILANTYHLLLRPGPEVFRRMGGIHRFMNWKRGVLTDSGGFQIFSLSHSVRLSEEGAEFRSYVDGKRTLLSPELSISMQQAAGSDIMMVLDQCIPSTSGWQASRQALEITTRWARRSIEARGDSRQALFGIVQGACFEDLRQESASQITSLPLDGYAIGGLAVGETRSQREDMTEFTAALLPADRPRYLMGVGKPIDILEGVRRGIDMFDCIIPTALAQQGVCFSSHGRIDLSRGVHKMADQPIDRVCGCPTCQSYSRAYLCHLIKAGELLAGELIGIHNLHFYLNLMQRIRAAIVGGKFADFYKTERPQLEKEDEDNPAVPPKRRARRIPNKVGAYEIVKQPGGFASIRHLVSGEIMHSVNNPVDEANRLYVSQSRLLELVALADAEFVIWDVGLGAATNAMCAIMAYERLAAESVNRPAPLRVISFENDLDSLSLAILYPGLFAHLRHPAPGALLKEGFWRSLDQSVSWELYSADFLKTFSYAAVPDLIFFDPFSYKTDPTLWHRSCFKKIAGYCQEHTTRLYTYSASTVVRAALLASGFYVGRGMGTGPKSETTVAYTTGAAHEGDLLDEDFLARWERSDAKFPPDLTPAERDEFAARVRGHPQFQNGR